MSCNKIKGLYCVIDSAWVKLPAAGDSAKKLVKAGVEIIQLRAKDEGSRAVLDAAVEVRAATRGKALFIVNDRLGGITADSAAAILEAGASAAAVISDILLAEDIGARAGEIISRIRPVLMERRHGRTDEKGP